MAAQNSGSPNNSDDIEITLGLLNAVDEDKTVTQRSLARDLGIALGLANTYLKRCAKKGFVKVTQVPANRYAYFLTPKGLAEKSRLTAEFLTQSFKLFRMAKEEYTEIIKRQISSNRAQIAVFGRSDLTEIVFLCARELKIDLVGLVASNYSDSEIDGIPVKNAVSDLDKFDIIIIADLADPQNTYENLVNIVGPKRVVAPNFLNISRYSPKKGQKN